MLEKNKARCESESQRAGGMFDSGGPSLRAYDSTKYARRQAQLEKDFQTELRGLRSPSHETRFISALCCAALLEMWADIEEGAL